MAVDPRSALKGVLEKAEEKGWTCMSGAEFEVSLGSGIVLLQTACVKTVEIRVLMDSTSNSRRHLLRWTKRTLLVYRP